MQLYLVKMRSFWRRVSLSYNKTDVLKEENLIKKIKEKKKENLDTKRHIS